MEPQTKAEFLQTIVQSFNLPPAYSITSDGSERDFDICISNGNWKVFISSNNVEPNDEDDL